VFECSALGLKGMCTDILQDYSGVVEVDHDTEKAANDG